MKVIKDMYKIGKYLFEHIDSCIVVCSILFGFLIFLFQIQQLSPRVALLEQQFSELRHNSDTEHKNLEKSISDNRYEFKVITTKLDTTLSQISTDLQYIKQKFMR